LWLSDLQSAASYQAALSNAEDELTALLARWRRFAGQVAPNELPAILRNRAAVPRGRRDVSYGQYSWLITIKNGASHPMVHRDL